MVDVRFSSFLRGLRDMMKGNSKKGVNMTVKWDGTKFLLSSVVYTPETNQFFVAKEITLQQGT